MVIVIQKEWYEFSFLLFCKVVGIDFSKVFDKTCVLDKDFENNDYYLWNINN